MTLHKRYDHSKILYHIQAIFNAYDGFFSPHADSIDEPSQVCTKSESLIRNKDGMFEL